MEKCLLCKKLTKERALHETCLANLWIFQHLERADIEALTRQAQVEHFTAGQVLFRQGETANRIRIIKAGRIRIWKITEEGNEITLDIRQAGDVLGENTFHEDGFIPVNATCLEETYTCGLTKDKFESLVLTNPNIGLQIIKNLCQRVDWLTSRVAGLSYSNLEDRLYRILVSVAQEHGQMSDRGIILPMPLTHEDLSYLAGAHRVSISRAMKALQNSGQVLRQGKFLIVRRDVTGEM